MRAPRRQASKSTTEADADARDPEGERRVPREVAGEACPRARARAATRAAQTIATAKTKRPATSTTSRVRAGRPGREEERARPSHASRATRGDSSRRNSWIAAVDVLDDVRPADGHPARAVGKLVLPLLLAVFRIHVDRQTCAKHDSGSSSRFEPKPLDLALPGQVVSEEVARHGELVIGRFEVASKERDRKSLRTSGSALLIFTAFRVVLPSCPVQHAAGCMKWLASTSLPRDPPPGTCGAGLPVIDALSGRPPACSESLR